MPVRLDEFSLNKDIPTPLYYQLSQQLLDKIKSGAFKVGDQIPNESELTEGLSISRSTVRQAISELVSEGYLLRVKAKGTFVSKPKVDEGFFQILESFNAEMMRKGLTPSTKVLSLKKLTGVEEITSRLHLPPGSMLIYLCRLRYADDEPVVYLETFLPFDRFEGLIKTDFTSASLYTELEEIFGARITRAVRQIEAAGATSQEAELLEMKKNAPICLVKTVAYTHGDIPAEYSIARYRGDRNKFSVELIRK